MPSIIRNHQDSWERQRLGLLQFYCSQKSKCRQVLASQPGLGQLRDFLSCGKLCPASSVSRKLFLSLLSLSLWSLLLPAASWMLVLLRRLPASCCHPPSGQTSVHLPQQEQPPISTAVLPKQVLPIKGRKYKKINKIKIKNKQNYVFSLSVQLRYLFFFIDPLHLIHPNQKFSLYLSLPLSFSSSSLFIFLVFPYPTACSIQYDSKLSLLFFLNKLLILLGHTITFFRI